jgi:hypothetical protein
MPDKLIVLSRSKHVVPILRALFEGRSVIFNVFADTKKRRLYATSGAIIVNVDESSAHGCPYLEMCGRRVKIARLLNYCYSNGRYVECRRYAKFERLQ